ncbi:hypothetical protein [Lentibacillus amyloliquefaciens]|nr:hypothetical protein [Lentibacillus amyloliquefaciens]
MLKDDFGTSYYIGPTSENNSLMLKVFEASDCNVTERYRIFTLNRRS